MNRGDEREQLGRTRLGARPILGSEISALVYRHHADRSWLPANLSNVFSLALSQLCSPSCLLSLPPRVLATRAGHYAIRSDGMVPSLLPPYLYCSNHVSSPRFISLLLPCSSPWRAAHRRSCTSYSPSRALTMALQPVHCPLPRSTSLPPLPPSSTVH